MRKILIACAVIAVGAVAVPADAADNGFYLGASVGAAGVKYDDFESSNFDYDAGSIGYKIIAGWRFLDWLAVEADYIDLGNGDDKVNGVKIETDVSGATLSAVGFLPVGPVDVFARVGAIDWSTDISAPSFNASQNDDGIDFTYGVGAQFRLGSLALRAEYEQFDVTDADSVDLVSVGLTWTFL